jgi:hypothetical protein
LLDARAVLFLHLKVTCKRVNDVEIEVTVIDAPLHGALDPVAVVRK